MRQGCPQPQLLEPLAWTGQHPSLRLTVDKEHDVPAVLTHRTHGHTGVAARVRGPGTGQGEDPAPGEDLRPQEEASVSLGTSGSSTHTSPSGVQTPELPQVPGNLELCPDLTSVPQKSPLEQCYS